MITISRADVIKHEIVDTQDPRRFIKIPINPYLDLLGVTPIESQNAIINAINSPHYRFVCAAISRRQGKTYIANIIGQMVSLIPGSHILIMSPNYSLSTISFDLQRSLIKHFGLEVVKDNAKDKVIELTNGSTIRMGSVNQVDSVVGRSYDLIIFDEAALTDTGEEAFNVALRPTLDKDNSKALFISTPRGRNNWFSRFWDRGFDPNFPEWVSIQATYHENPRISADDIKEAKLSMSEAEFKQEYMADFNIFEGQIWNFDHSCVEDLSGLDTSRMDIIGGLDVGFRDPTALVIVAYSYDEDKYYILNEYQDKELTTEQQARAVGSLLDKYSVDYCFIDSANQQTKYDFAHMYDISCTDAKKSKTDGIGFVASVVDNNKLIVDQNCAHVLASLDQYQWDPNPNLLQEKPKHNKYCHMADAIRYALYSFTVSCSGF